MKRIIAKMQLLFTSLVICSILVLTGCSPKTYNLSTSVAPSGGGTVSPSGGPFQGKVTLVATPAQYYIFSGWAGAASGTTNPLTVTMNSDKQIVAQFTRIKPTVQVTSNPPDGGIIRPSSGAYDAGSTVTFTVTPSSGYRFLNWGGDASGNTNPLNVVINNDKVITANFIKQYTLTVSADPNAGTVSPSVGMYDSGSAVNLTATPSFPYAFTNWVGADNNNINPTKVSMNSDKTISVTFTKQVGGELITTPSQKIYNGSGTIPINLNQYEWLEGTLNCGNQQYPCHAYIQGPTGDNVKDFGTCFTVNFQFMAPVSGKYNFIIVANGNLTNQWGSVFQLAYAVYK